jgi:hypothetical protein
MKRQNDCLALLASDRIDAAQVAKLFDEASPGERVEMTEAIDGRAQARLWLASEGHGVTIEQMVPSTRAPLDPVIFHGKNSLAAFSHFQKRFCRPTNDADELWGYNHQPTRWLAPLTGPGYFVAYDSDEPLGGVAVDYRRIPTARPDDWPEIHDNTWRLSRFIYNGMVDYLRRVSEHLLIGRATRDGRELPNYFLLCRKDDS